MAIPTRAARTVSVACLSALLVLLAPTTTSARPDPGEPHSLARPCVGPHVAALPSSALAGWNPIIVAAIRGCPAPGGS